MSHLIPDPHLIDSHINADLSYADALAEFVDNSLAKDAGGADHITITLGKNYITVEDNGRGVDDINALFRLGQSLSQHSKSDIGLYGVGAKSAAIRLGQTLTVTSVTKAGMLSHHVDWAQARKQKVWPDACMRSPKKTDAPLGTRVVVGRPWPGRKRIVVQAIVDNFSRTFMPALLGGTKITIHDDRNEGYTYDVDAYEPPDLTDVMEFDSEADGRAYHCRAGIMEKTSERWSGLWLCFGHRVLRIERCPLDQLLHARIFARIDLSTSWKDCLSTHKNGLATYESELYTDVLAKLASLLQLATEHFEELRLANLSAQFSSHASKIFAFNTGTGSHGPGSYVKGVPGNETSKQDPEKKPRPRLNSNGEGTNDQKEVDATAPAVLVRYIHFGDDRYIYRGYRDPAESCYKIELNLDHKTIQEMVKSPLQALPNWQLICTALAEMAEDGTETIKKNCPALAVEYADEWKGGEPSMLLLQRQILSYLSKVRPAIKEPKR